MKNLTKAAALAAIVAAGISSGFENAPGVAVRAEAAQASAQDAAKNFNPKTDVDVSGEKIAFKLPDGISAKIAGTTFEQIVAFDGKIRRPLSPKSTMLTLALTDASGATAQTAAFEVSVPAVAQIGEVSAARNAKPAVVPALQEWIGGEGAFVPDDDFAVVVLGKDVDSGNPSLRARAKLFARELSEIFGRKIKVRSEARGWQKIGDLSVPKGNDIFLILEKSEHIAALGKEGYCIAAQPSGLAVIASDSLGAFWGTRTILQVFKQNGNTFPSGMAADYPQYPVRGFMYDVGRKPASLEAVRNVMKTMSYYKLNDFQLHLNDNFIWLHDYTKIPNGKNASAADKKRAIAEVLEAAPTAFRLESDVVGKNGIPLTAPDYFYTKKEFGEFIDEAKLYGVGIVPELDVPGHAMSFVRVRPELMYRGDLTKPHDVERTAMLDASHDIFDKKTGKTYLAETLDFVQSVFDEYLVGKNGEEPVFRDCVVHIGTDEYYGNAEDYRAFADAMLKYVKSRGHTPRFWGSLSRKTGKTPVVSDGVQMHIWSLDWERPQDAVNAGYGIVNILDRSSYVVPSGTGSVGAYCDNWNLPALYSADWQPNKMGQFVVVPGLPQMLGAQLALWNDNSFRRDTGLTDFDLYDRIRKGCAVMSEKTWSTGTDAAYADFAKLVKKAGLPPLSNPEYTVKADENGTLFSLGKTNIPAGKQKKLAAGTTGIAPNYSAEIVVRRTDASEAPLTLFSGPTGRVMAVQEDTGKVGITRDTWNYSFDYTLPVGRKVKLEFVASGRTLTLFADGKEIGAPVRDKFPETHKYSTFVFPTEKIGAKENKSAIEIDSLKISKTSVPGTQNAVPAEEFRSVRASSEQGTGADGDASCLADGDTSTYWHSRYSPKKDTPPFEIVVEFSKPEKLSAFAFLPRQDNDNGNVKRAELYLKKGENGAWKKVGTFSSGGKISREIRRIKFAPQTADALKFVVLDGNGGFGTIAEIYPIREK